MKIVRRAPNKFWVFVGGRAFVLRLEKEAQLIPRWRVLSSLYISTLFAGAGLALREPLVGLPMLAVSLICLWAASR